ncbi:MAG: TIGR03758 family integrating conjugative element protein [Chromatiales bacterium]|nr:TIGR03758 family integrating conjugative element protein [Chromatiales bacterium]
MLNRNYNDNTFVVASGISPANLELLFSTTLSILIFMWFVYRLMALYRGLQHGALSETAFLFQVLRTIALIILIMAFAHYLLSS